MFRIGIFSKMSKTTIKTLRYYDEIGLLKPEETDSFTGYRLYTTNQLLRLHRIQAYRQIGLSIEEIKLILADQNTETILENRKAELKAELADAQDRLSRIEFILKGENHMNYSATIKEIPACIVYSKTMTVPDYSSYFQVIPAIGAQITAKYPDLKCAVPKYCYIVYLDGEYKERDIKIEYCEAVTEIRPDFDDIVFKKTEALTVLSVMHRRNYNDLPKAYAYAMRWIEENGYTTTDFARESYIDGVWNKEKEEDWLTEIQVPVVKK